MWDEGCTLVCRFVCIGIGFLAGIGVMLFAGAIQDVRKMKREDRIRVP